MHPISKKQLGSTGILCHFSDSNVRMTGYVKKQIGTRRYVVTNGSVTKICTLAQTLDDAQNLPDGICTFPLISNTGLVEHVNHLTATKCGTVEGNVHAWHTATATPTVAHVISNNLLYYNLEQPTDDGLQLHNNNPFGISFSVSSTVSSFDVRMLLGRSTNFPLTSFSISLVGDNSISPNLSDVLITQIIFESIIPNNFNNYAIGFTGNVSLSPGRYWIVLDEVDGNPSNIVLAGEFSLTDPTVISEYISVVGTTLANADFSEAIQFSIEVL